MPIAVDELRAAAAQFRVTKFADSMTDARRRGVRTAFLCHSHKDAQLAEGLVALLAQHGWRLYVDWKDAEMPERPNRETAERIQARIVECNYFLFLATGNSTQSRWCPWDAGDPRPDLLPPAHQSGASRPLDHGSVARRKNQTAAAGRARAR